MELYDKVKLQKGNTRGVLQLGLIKEKVTASASFPLVQVCTGRRGGNQPRTLLTIAPPLTMGAKRLSF